MTPEQELITDLLERGATSAKGITEALSLISRFPATLAEFEALSPVGRVATTAMLKNFEQLEDTLASLFRAILKALGQSLKGLYALDVGNRMVELGILDDAQAWLDVVKLRNELVHEYPLAAKARFGRLDRAHAAIPMLDEALRRAEAYVRHREWLP